MTTLNLNDQELKYVWEAICYYDLMSDVELSDKDNETFYKIYDLGADKFYLNNNVFTPNPTLKNESND